MRVAASEKPARVYLNLTRPGIGGCVGFVYESAMQANIAATGHRLTCIEINLSDPTGLSPAHLNLLRAEANKRKTTPEALLDEMITLFLAEEQ